MAHTAVVLPNNATDNPVQVVISRICIDLAPNSLTPSSDITPLLDGILKHVPPPKVNEGPLQMQITSLDYSSFLGRIAIGKVTRGSIREGQPIALMQVDGSVKKSKVKELYIFESLGKKKVTEVIAGDICAVVGLEDFNIGDLIATHK